MPAINDHDLPLLELLAAAPGRVVPAEKVEPIALILAARGLLQTERLLEIVPPNGAPPRAPGLVGAFYSAARYRCTFLSGESYGLTHNGGLYLQDLGIETSEQEAAAVAELVARETTDLLREAEALLRQ